MSNESLNEQQDAESKSAKRKQALGFLMLGMAAGILYFIPYMRANYYSQFQLATGLTNGQIGELASIYGLVGMFGYIPSGILADRFSARSLISLALILSGCLIFWHATMPDFNTLRIIYASLAVTSLMLFWAAFLKALRLIADEKDQGKSYGGNEMLRWFWRFVISSAGLAVLAAYGDNVKAGFVAMLIFSGCVYILVGICCFLFIPKEAMGNRVIVGEEKKFSWKDVLEVLKIPGAWLLTGAIFCAYLVYNSYIYLTPYFVDVMKMDPQAASIVAIIRTYVLGVGAVFAGGWLSDMSAKSASRSRVMVIIFICVCVSYLPMFFIDGNGNYTVLAVILACLITFLITSFRGIYWAVLGEAGVGISKTGMVVGMASVIAYSSDAFIFSIWGNILDNNPGVEGYRIIFASVVVFAIIGCIFSFMIMTRAKKNITRLKEQNDL